MSTAIIDDKRKKPCLHPDHNPPGHIVIPQGKIMEHTCSACGEKVVIYPSSIL